MENVSKAFKKFECPIDHELFTTTPDHFNNERIRNFKVRCPNKVRGCQWQGNLWDIDKHTNNNCDCLTVTCCNTGCNVKLEKRKLADHMQNVCSQRKYKCPYCIIEDKYFKVTTLHNLWKNAPPLSRWVWKTWDNEKKYGSSSLSRLPRWIGTVHICHCMILKQSWIEWTVHAS